MTETLAGDASLACKTNNKGGRVAIKAISVKAVITRLSPESAAPSISGEFNRAALARILSSSFFLLLRQLFSSFHNHLSLPPPPHLLCLLFHNEIKLPVVSRSGLPVCMFAFLLTVGGFAEFHFILENVLKLTCFNSRCQSHAKLKGEVKR